MKKIVPHFHECPVCGRQIQWQYVIPLPTSVGHLVAVGTCACGPNHAVHALPAAMQEDKEMGEKE